MYLKSESFYQPTFTTRKMAANPLKSAEIRREMTNVPALQLLSFPVLDTVPFHH